MLHLHCEVLIPQLILVFRNNMKPGLMMHLLMALILSGLFVQATSAMMNTTMSETVQQERHLSRRNIKDVLDMMIFTILLSF